MAFSEHESSESQFSVAERRSQLGTQIDELRARLKSYRDFYHPPLKGPNPDEAAWVPMLDQLEQEVLAGDDASFEGNEATYTQRLNQYDAAITQGLLPDEVDQLNREEGR